MDQNLSGLSSEQFQANRFDIVSRLADDLAHEIKNPLNAIIINLEVLKVRIARADSEGAADRAAVIEQEVRRLHQLIDRMLMLIRPERAEASNLPVDSALDEILPLVQAQARLARNELRADCEGTVFIPVRRDIFKFALLNLLMAVHARLGEGGGILQLECRAEPRDVRIRITAIATDGAALVDGAQAGIGEAADISRALLAPVGARFSPVDDGVTIVIPRAASV